MVINTAEVLEKLEEMHDGGLIPSGFDEDELAYLTDLVEENILETA